MTLIPTRVSQKINRKCQVIDCSKEATGMSHVSIRDSNHRVEVFLCEDHYKKSKAGETLSVDLSKDRLEIG